MPQSNAISASNHDLFLADPDAFMRELNKPSVTVETLQKHRNRVQDEADEVNIALKKNVYKNYALFIDSAKEISLLKNEMYSLSRLLNEQQTLLSSFTDLSISGDRTHGLTLNEKKEVAAKFRSQDAYNEINGGSSSVTTGRGDNLHDQVNYGKGGINAMNRSQSHGTFAQNASGSSSSKDLTSVLNKIEGGTGILEPRNRVLLYHGELIELDPEDYSRVSGQQKILLVLLNDCLISAQAFPFLSKTGKKYKYQSYMELENVAVVNVKDSSFQSAFKVLMATLTRVFQAESPEHKKKWLDAFESAKKTRRASLSAFHRRDSLMFGSMDASNLQSVLSSSSANQAVNSKGLLSPDRNVYSFDEELEDVSESESEMIPLWLQECPDDMDVLIAQRNFEDAVTLVVKVNDHLVLYPKCYDVFMQNDLKLRVNHKIQELIECISNELQASPDRSLQSGPRSARRAVQLLLKLGKASLACKLFLNQRSSILNFSLKQQITEGSPLTYIKRLISVFFNNVIETSREFEKAFKTMSALTNFATGDASNSQPPSLNDRDSIVNGTDMRSPTPLFPPAYPMACLVVWVQKELNSFLKLFSENVLLPSVPTAVINEAIAIVKNQADRLKNAIGLDLLFHIDKFIKNGLNKLVNDDEEISERL